MKYYGIQAGVTRVENGWRSTVWLPTFFLREDMQMIQNVDHAEEIARQMIMSLSPETNREDIHLITGVCEQ